jgi:DnaJ-class molecular chaperone
MYTLKYKSKNYTNIDELFNDVIKNETPELINCSTCKNTGTENVWYSGARGHEYADVTCSTCNGKGGKVVVDLTEILKGLDVYKDDKYTPWVKVNNVKTKNI